MPRVSVSRFALHAGLVTFRQTFVCRCQNYVAGPQASRGDRNRLGFGHDGRSKLCFLMTQPGAHLAGVGDADRHPVGITNLTIAANVLTASGVLLADRGQRPRGNPSQLVAMR